LLDLLTADDYRRLSPHLEPVSLNHEEDLFTADAPLSHVYFPVSGMISLMVLMEEGRGVEVATVGNEGMVGVAAALGLDTMPHQAITRVPGENLRLPVADFRHALARSPRLEALVRRYVAVTLRHANQLVACNALHPVEARMCRWLLSAHDRVRADRFPITQESLAHMLGVRRQTVTAVASGLQRAGLLAYRRGKARVLNRKGLEAAACECYQVMRSFYDRTLLS
jgi:CRP-like cAMP-binding protein